MAWRGLGSKSMSVCVCVGETTPSSAYSSSAKNEHILKKGSRTCRSTDPRSVCWMRSTVWVPCSTRFTCSRLKSATSVLLRGGERRAREGGERTRGAT